MLLVYSFLMMLVQTAATCTFKPQTLRKAPKPCAVVEPLQVKKRGRWLHRFSLDVLAKLPGTQDDPFDGVTIDTNSLGGCWSGG